MPSFTTYHNPFLMEFETSSPKTSCPQIPPENTKAKPSTKLCLERPTAHASSSWHCNFAGIQNTTVHSSLDLTPDFSSLTSFCIQLLWKLLQIMQLAVAYSVCPSSLLEHISRVGDDCKRSSLFQRIAQDL